MTPCLHYILGVSLGTGMQQTAIAVIEQEISENGLWRPGIEALRLRWLERVSLDSGIPETVSKVKKLLEQEEIKLKEGAADVPPEVVLNITGTGHAPVEIFKGVGIKPTLVTIAGMKEEETEPSDWRISQKELIGNLDLLFQTDRLQMASKLALAADLTDELNKFRENPRRINPNDPEAWREGQFDELVFSAAVAAWRAVRFVPRPGHMGHERARYVENRLKEIGQSVI